MSSQDRDREKDEAPKIQRGTVKERDTIKELEGSKEIEGRKRAKRQSSRERKGVGLICLPSCFHVAPNREPNPTRLRAGSTIGRG